MGVGFKMIAGRGLARRASSSKKGVGFNLIEGVKCCFEVFGLHRVLN